MLFDVLIVIVLAIFATFGFRNGFAMSFAKVGGWILAFILAFFFQDNMRAWLIEHTKWFDDLHTHVFEVCNELVAKYTEGIASSLPPTETGEPVELVSQETILKATDKIANSSFTVFVFIGIIVIVVVIVSILAFIISNRDGVLGGIDGFSGLLFGLFQGIVAVIVITAFLVPIAHVVSPEMYAYITINMEESTFAKLLYENNPIIFLIDGALPSDLNPMKWLNLNHLGGTGIDLKDWGNLL